MSCALCKNLIGIETLEHHCDARIRLCAGADIHRDVNVYRVDWISPTMTDLDYGHPVFNKESFFDREDLARKFYNCLREILVDYYMGKDI